MNLTYKTLPKSLPKTPLLVLFGCAGKKPVLPAGVKVAPALLKDFRGEFREVRITYAGSGPAERVMLVGLGKAGEVDGEKLRRAAAIAAQRAENQGVASAAVVIASTWEKTVDAHDTGCAVAEGALMGSYRYQENKSKAKPRRLKSVTLYGSSKPMSGGVSLGKTTAVANTFARDLQNGPGNLITPRKLAAEARKLANGSPRLRCTVIDEAKMKQMGMGLLLGVSRGSTEPARLIHLVYKPKGKSKAKIAFVGKGLTFDAGGISLKPSGKMDEMRYDMSGGAAVLGAFRGLRELDVPYEVHGIVPTSENMPDAAATKPGDIHTAMNGTTVEVLNTDAEGRLILGDALAYTVSKIKPDTIIDLATLTGAVVVGLGHEVSGMFASTERLRDDLTAAGEDVGERVWPLPLLPFHREKMKGVSADLRNISTPDMGAGSCGGAAFLSYFVGDTEWCHLDIAGTAWGSANRDYVGGAQGSGVGSRLLLRYLERRR